MKKIFAIALVLVFSLSGCILAILTDSASDSGLTPASRRKVFDPRINAFHEFLQRKKFDSAFVFVSDPTQRDEVKKFINSKFGSADIVGKNITSTEFTEDAFYVAASVTIQTYKPGVNILKDVPVTESWKYNIGSGWTLTGITSP